jgi:hypothetical protein
MKVCEAEILHTQIREKLEARIAAVSATLKRRDKRFKVDAENTQPDYSRPSLAPFTAVISSVHGRLC